VSNKLTHSKPWFNTITPQLSTVSRVAYTITRLATLSGAIDKLNLMQN